MQSMKEACPYNSTKFLNLTLTFNIISTEEKKIVLENALDLDQHTHIILNSPSIGFV